MNEYKEKRRRSSGRYFPRRKFPYLSRTNRAGGGYSGPRSYARQHEFRYSGAEQQPREPKTEISSYVKSPSEHYSEKSQVQPDIEVLLEELKRTRDPALHDVVTNRLNDETEQIEKDAKIPEVESKAEPIDAELTNVNITDEISPAQDPEYSEISEEQNADHFVMEPLEPLVQTETTIERSSTEALESTLNDLDALALELYANPLETKMEEETVERENTSY